MNEEYTQEQWQMELNHPAQCQLCDVIARFYATLRCNSGLRLNCLGACLSCPDCKTVGFYAARHEPNKDIRYRMCKFCGFRQEVGGKPHYCNMFVHDHCLALHDCPDFVCKVLQYDWNSGDSHNHFCGATMTKTLRPTEREKHPQHKLKEAIKKIL